MVFVLGSVYVVDCVYRLACVEPVLHPLNVMDKLFDVLLKLVCQYFIEDFYIEVHHGYWPEVFFFLLSLCQVLVTG